MSQLLEEAQFETNITTSRLVHSDVGSVGDLTSNSTPKDFHDYTATSTEATPEHSPTTVRRTSSLPRSNRGGNLVMNDRDKGIYNALGSSSSSSGKVSSGSSPYTLWTPNWSACYRSRVRFTDHYSLYMQLTYSELGLTRGWKKRGIMWKTGRLLICCDLAASNLYMCTCICV